jgi:hypothetical protein
MTSHPEPTERFEVQRQIAAPPSAIFRLLSDPRGHVDIDISGTIQPPIKHLFGYRLEPRDGGTLVTSYYDWSQIDDRYRDRGVFPVIPEAALRATLGILARTVEQPPAT